MHFLHGFCCSRKLIKVSPSLIYMKNDAGIVGVGEADYSGLNSHSLESQNRKQAKTSAELSFRQHTVSIARGLASTFHFGCED